jgi:glucose/arabinose dehydrogenase
MRMLLCCLLGLLAWPAVAAPPLQRLTLPPGSHIAVYSAQVPNARAMTLGALGAVFVGSAGAGKLYALTEADGDGERVRVIASGLKLPLGVAFHHGSDDLVGAVYRINYRAPQVK